ncbi:hypothetical protein ACLB1T_25050 [Escherichia coli]
MKRISRAFGRPDKRRAASHQALMLDCRMRRGRLIRLTVSAIEQPQGYLMRRGHLPEGFERFNAL